MKQVSRRELTVGANDAPLATTVAVDGVVAKADEWIVGDLELTRMQLEWQGLETTLFDKSRRLQIGCADACKSDAPEAKAMRALDGEIEQTRHALDVIAKEVSSMPSTTIADAIAKIDLGLKVQGPFDWRDCALELAHDGIAELRSLLGER